MVRILIFLLVVMIAAVPVMAVETTPEELLQTIEKMTPEQAHEVNRILSQRQWDPMPKGFFERMAVRASIDYLHTNKLDLSSLRLSAGDLELKDTAGSEVAVLWQIVNDKFRIGFKAGNLYAEDSDLNPNGYSRVEFQQQTAAFVANYQLIRTDAFLWWGEMGLGGGNIDLDIVDTPAGAATTLAYYEKEYGFGDLTTGVDWRFNSELSLNAYVGYRFADNVTLKEAWRETDITVEPQGVKAALGLCYNF